MKNIKSMKVFEMGGDFVMDEIEQLSMILEDIENLMQEANEIVRNTAREVGDEIIYERWKAYPYNNIMSMLSSGSRYDTSFSDIIEELQKATGEEDDF